MNRVMKRALVAGAVLPMALITAGAADAATYVPKGNDLEKTGNVVTANCWHNNLGDFGYKMVITLDGAGDYADADDVNTVRVTASDATGLEGFDENNDTQVTSVRVDLWRSDFNKIEDKTNQGRPIMKTQTDSSFAFTGDGDTTLNFDPADNVKYVSATVNWSNARGYGPEVLVCTAKLPGGVDA